MSTTPFFSKQSLPRPRVGDSLPKVKLAVQDAPELLRRYYPNGKWGGLTVDGQVPLNVGQFVELLVHVAQPARQLSVQGQLAWARYRGSKAFAESFGIDFVPHDEGGRERVLKFARQELSPEAFRLDERILTDLPIKLLHSGQTRKEFLVDLSLGGAFIRSAEPLTIGEPVEMHLRAPGSLFGLKLQGRVVWTRQVDPNPGMGVMFASEGGEPLLKLAKLLKHISRS